MANYYWFMPSFLIVLSLISLNSKLTADFSNIKCVAIDRKFLLFPTCELTLIKRGTRAASVFADFLKTPVHDFWVRFKLLKKSNGFRPFIIDLKFDFCRFLENKNNPLAEHLYSFIDPYLDMESHCPFHRGLNLSQMVFNTSLVRANIFPDGDYCIQMHFFSDKRTISEIKVYFTFEEKKNS